MKKISSIGKITSIIISDENFPFTQKKVFCKMDKNVTYYWHFLQCNNSSLDINQSIRHSKDAYCCQLSMLIILFTFP